MLMSVCVCFYLAICDAIWTTGPVSGSSRIICYAYRSSGFLGSKCSQATYLQTPNLTQHGHLSKQTTVGNNLEVLKKIKMELLDDSFILLPRNGSIQIIKND